MGDRIPHYQVVCAIIFNSQDKEQVLVAQRRVDDINLPGKYEFPGGKIEMGETPEHAIIREIQEELSMNVKPTRVLKTVDWDYEKFHITLMPILCESADQTFSANEHENVHWHNLSELHQLDWAPADVPIIDELLGKTKDL